MEKEERQGRGGRPRGNYTARQKKEDLAKTDIESDRKGDAKAMGKKGESKKEY